MYHKKRGSALLTALFLMTLVAIAATAMSTRLQLDIYRTRLTVASDRVLLAAQVISFWAMDSLVKPDIKFKSEDGSGLVLTFPKAMAGIYPDMQISAELYDLQARFNLNNLQQIDNQTIFFRFLKNSLPKTPLKELQDLVKATAFWVSPYQPARGVDDLMTYYAAQKPPYLPAFQPMQSITEFRLVAGVSANVYNTLYRYVTALPTVTPINVNTASPKILKALGSGLTDMQLEELLQLRSQKSIFQVGDMLMLTSQFNIPATQITIDSEYYLVSGRVTGSELSLKYYVALQVGKNRLGKKSVRVVTETLNTY